MSSLPASMKRIRSNTAEKTWWLRFSHYKSMGIFSDAQGQLTVIGGPIWPKFELIQDIMHVLITCKFEKDRINSKGEKVVSRIFRRSRAANSIVSGEIWPKFKFVQAFMHVLITCKYEKDPIKTAEKMRWHSFPHYKSMGIFYDAQGQLTLLSVVRSGQISNSWKLLCMSSLPASIKRIRSKTGEKTWWRPFPPIITLWELSVAIETRVLTWSAPKPNAAFPPPQWCFR